MLEKVLHSATSRLSSQAAALLALVALVFLWGYNWVVMKIAIQYASPFDYSALRVLLSGVCLLAVLLWLQKPALPTAIVATGLSGAFQLAGFYGLSTWALVNGGAGKTAILNYAMPFWVLMLAWLLLGERLRRFQWLSVLIALTGLLFILMPFSFREGLFSKGLALLSSVSWAVGIIISKRLQRQTKLDLLSYTTWQMLFGSIPLVLIALLIPSEPITWSTPFIAALIYSVIPGNAVAWLLWFFVLSRLSAGMAGLGALATPVVGVLAAWMQLGEVPTGLEAAGMALIVGALVFNAALALKPDSPG